MSSKRHYRRRSCEGKVRYETRADVPASTMSKYRCQFCGGWHQGHTAGRAKWRRNQKRRLERAR